MAQAFTGVTKGKIRTAQHLSLSHLCFPAEGQTSQISFKELRVSVPFVQINRVMRYVLRQRLRRRHRYPLVLMLEPLFRCNLSCAGCGKIAYPEEILSRRLSAEECLSSADECGAPVVSIAGGEPLMHPDMAEVVSGLVRQKKFVYLCTNGLLLKRLIADYTASPYLTVSIHLDGNRERHDALACRQGVYNGAIEAIKLAVQKGFRATVNCTFYEGTSPDEASQHLDFIMSMGVEGVTVSPGYSYPSAPQGEIFLSRERSKQLFREVFELGKGHDWRFNQTNLFLDFLAGNQSYPCSPWGSPTRNVFGWQRPCYVLSEGGYASTFKALMEETDWDGYGPGRHPQCSHCMLHSGFEPTAINDMFAHPLKALYVHVRGPGIKGPMAPESPSVYSSPFRFVRRERKKGKLDHAGETSAKSV
jgi:hopanoid biosynthesis associated radical SAM protein HpnH